jgi:protein phosphatase
MLLFGHTHLPFVRAFSDGSVANPGSVGQPKTGKPEACYATWVDGKFTLHSVPYNFRETIRKLSGLGLTEDVRRSLTTVLETGGSLPNSIARNDAGFRA